MPGILPLATTLADEAKVELGIANTGTQTFHGFVNIGIPPSQLPAIIAAATKPLQDLTEAQRHELDDIRAKLEVSEGALQGFLRTIGAVVVPPEKQAGQLLEIAQRHKELLAQLESANSSDPEVQQLKEQARQALDNGDFARTEELLNQAKARDLAAIEQMQANLDARKLSAAASAAENGDLMMTLLRYADAGRYYAEAVKLTPEQSAELLSSRLMDWAIAARRAGDYPTAVGAARRALALDEARLLPDNPRVATDLNNLAQFYQATGRYAEAEPLFERALAIDEKALGPDHPDLATDLNNLAMLYDDTGRYADAEPLMKRALAITEKALGPDYPDLAAELNNLAGLYDDTGRYADAEPLFERALAIDEKALGPDHPGVARGLGNLALVYEARAAMPMPSRSSSAPWRSTRRRSAPTIPTSPPASTISPGSIWPRATMPMPSRS